MTYHHTIEQVKEELRNTRGMVLNAATRLGVSKQALYRRIREDEDLQEFLNDIRDEIKDKAETNVTDAIMAGDREMSRWYLSQLASDRGYGNKVEIGGKIKHEIEKPDFSGLSIEELKQLEELRKKLAPNATNTDTD